MNSEIAASLKLKYSPVAIILTDEKPASALQFKEDCWGCVAAMLVAAARGRTAVFDRITYGCAGGGIGLGFEKEYKDFDIEYFLSIGCERSPLHRRHRASATEGERYFRTPALARQFVDSLPLTEIPAKYVVFTPLENVERKVEPTLVLLFANPDQLSALVVLANYDRARRDSVIVRFGAGCQSILFGYEEARAEQPRAIIGFFDITVRKLIDRDLLSFTVPFQRFLEMEANVEESFLEKEQWLRVAERIEEVQ